MTRTVCILMLSLVATFLQLVPAQAQDDKQYYVYLWNDDGKRATYAREQDIDCQGTGSGFKHITIGDLTGWADELPYPLQCGSFVEIDVIPGQVGETEFGDQCDRYSPIFQDLWNEDYGPWDSTRCYRMAPEVPLHIAAQIKLSGSPESLHSSRQEMQNLPDAERVLNPYDGADTKDPNNPLGSQIWGPGGRASFSWHGQYFTAFQPWLSADYYIVGGVGKVWHVPSEVITASRAEYFIPLPMDWQTAWEVPLTSEFDTSYRPPRGENPYPERPLYKHPRAYTGQLEWLEKYGRGNWREIAYNLTSVDGDISREMFALTFTEVLLDHPDIPDEDEQPIWVVMFDNSRGYIVTVNGQQPEVIAEEDNWLMIAFNYGTDSLVLSNGLQPVLRLNGLELQLSHPYYVVPLVSWVNEGVFVSGDWAGIEAVEPIWFDSTETTVPTSKWGIRLLGYEYIPFTGPLG